MRARDHTFIYTQSQSERERARARARRNFAEAETASLFKARLNIILKGPCQREREARHRKARRRRETCNDVATESLKEGPFLCASFDI